MAHILLSVVVNSSGVRAVAMVIYRASGVTYIRRIGDARGSFSQFVSGASREQTLFG